MSARRERSKCDACRFLEAGVLAFHDHGGNKLFGQAKITNFRPTVAAEDTRFYQHHGFDGHDVQIAAEHDLEGDLTHGVSTITQRLVKNLFFGTGRSILRKGAEFTLVPLAELVLGKRRILEIYLNVVEWGAGIYGAESACHYYDGTAARSVGLDQRHGSLRFCQLPSSDGQSA